MTIYNILWYFFIYAFLGWCLEVCFCSIQTGSFVNRGFLNGPVCPIYGFGMLIAGSSLAPVRDNLILLFFGGMVLASALELVGGWALKKLFHTTWWDYSDEPLNIGGYICLKFSLAWGVCVTFAVRVLHGFFYGLAQTTVTSLTTESIPDAHKGEGIGYYMLSVTVGSAIGPFLGTTLMHGPGFTVMFALCAIVAAVALAGATSVHDASARRATDAGAREGADPGRRRAGER